MERIRAVEGYLGQREVWSDGMSERFVRAESRLAEHDKSLNDAWAAIGQIKVKWSFASMIASAIGGLVSGVVILVVAEWIRALGK